MKAFQFGGMFFLTAQIYIQLKSDLLQDIGCTHHHRLLSSKEKLIFLVNFEEFWSAQRCQG